MINLELIENAAITKESAAVKFTWALADMNGLLDIARTTLCEYNLSVKVGLSDYKISIFVISRLLKYLISQVASRCMLQNWGRSTKCL